MQANNVSAMVVVANNKDEDGGIDLLGYWTGITAAISTSLTPVAETATEAAARNAGVGRAMTDLAADYASSLARLASGVGNPAEREALQAVAGEIQQAIDNIRSTGTSAYTSAGEAVVTAARASTKVVLAEYGGAAVDLVDLTIKIVDAIDSGDWNDVGGSAAGIGAAAVAGVIAGAAVAAVATFFGIAGLPVVAATFVIAGAAAYGAAKLGPTIFDGWSLILNGAGSLISDAFEFAQRFLRDPLILDLDGDGLETLSPSESGVLFDHNGSGVKTSSGWIKSDDGFLVFDRNGNGTIDSGRELFGDATALYAGGTAVDGFDALRQEDSNGDNKVSSADSNWSQLRIWRDLNKDGHSQSDELFTLADAGVAAINVGKTENNVMLANGNQLADLGSFIRTDGARGTLAGTSIVADINLAQDTYHSQFSDEIPIDTDLKSMPEIEGVGLVRDLRQAASMDSSAGSALKAALLAFVGANSVERFALVDAILLAWADTSTLIGHMQDRQPSTTKVVWSNASVRAEWEGKLHILEAFNGRYFFKLPGEAHPGAPTGLSLGAADTNGMRTATVNMPEGQIRRLQDAYENLKEAVYSALIAPEIMQNYLGLIDVQAENDGLNFDFTAMNAALDAEFLKDPAAGLADVLNLARYANAQLVETGYDIWTKLETAARSGGTSAATLDALNIRISGGNNDTVAGTAFSDVLYGGSGNDSLSGQAGNDVLAGDAGNDTLAGGLGNDIYLFNPGDGLDRVEEGVLAGEDTLQLGIDINAASIQVLRQNLDLTLKVNAVDSVTIADYFKQGSIEKIVFSNGLSWDFQEVMRRTIYTGSSGNDELYGLATVGNKIDGMEGNDRLYGGEKNDSLQGSAGIDQLRGYVGDDTLHGGTGSDTLDGASGDDTYIFELGDGNDTVFDSGVAHNKDKVQFGAGIAAGGVTLNRSGSDLILLVNATDKLTLKSYADSPSYRIESIAFADGTVWDIATVAGMPSFGTAGADILYAIDGYANHLNGMDGNDTLSGQSKADVLLGGGGNDQLRGYVGDDTPPAWRQRQRHPGWRQRKRYLYLRAGRWKRHGVRQRLGPQ
ncbi:calcium-binding protein [Massilia atriviolacea]|uniref:calcium-binding protein n=1 Tax=Massilia atriviolacea TaxID=2495579 RepID=UPI003857CC2B